MFNRCMSNIRYILWPILTRLDGYLAVITKRAGKGSDKHYGDLDWFIGNGLLDSSFGEAIDWLNSLPNDLEAGTYNKFRLTSSG